MKELYELRDRLCDELKTYGKKDMSAGSLDVVDKLTHAIKNLDKIIDADEGYSGMDRSYARRRDSMGRYSRNYSYHGDMVHELEKLMDDAPNDSVRNDIQRLINKVRN